MDKADKSFELLAGTYFANQLDKLAPHLQGALTADDPECVHQIRVASRRIRAGLKFFKACFVSELQDQLSSEIKSLTKSLGPARDADVQLLYIEKMISKLKKKDKDALRGLKRLHLRISRRRSAMQPEVIGAVETIVAHKALQAFSDWVKTIVEKRSSSPISVRSEFGLHKAASKINKRIDKLLPHACCLRDPTACHAHHKMRIAAKKLRYTMEICEPLYEGVDFESMIVAVKKLQTYLGEAHDCDVWKQNLEKFEESEKQAAFDYSGRLKLYKKLIPGIEFVRADRAKQRSKYFSKACTHWRKLEKERFWQGLKSTVCSDEISV